MSFLHPEFIYFMMPMLFILFYFLLTQADQMHLFFSAEVVERLRVYSNRMSLRTRNVLFFLMFIMLVLALAFPVVEEGKVKVQAKRTDIMIALDISDSMLAKDVYPSRLKLAKAKLLEVLDRASSQRLGVMAFAKDAYLVVPLTFDHHVVRFLVEQFRPSLITEKGSDFLGLLHAAQTVMDEQTSKKLLIFSDGGEQQAFTREIAYAKRHGICVYVLGVGTHEGAAIIDRSGALVNVNGEVVITRLNSAIASLAIESGGSYIESVLSDRDIVAMLEEIIGRHDANTVVEEEVTQYIPLFYFPLGLAMLLLMIATSSMSKREKLQMPGSFLLAWLLMQGVPAHAGLMDFKVLDEAKKAYESGAYLRSARLYGEYVKTRRSDEALYDQANALYRSGKYEAAARAYEKVAFSERDHHFDTLHNLGNAYAKQGKTAALRKAIAAYGKALKLKEDAQTRENLDQVKALMQKTSSRDKRPLKRESQVSLRSPVPISDGEPGAGMSDIPMPKHTVQEGNANTPVGSGRQAESPSVSLPRYDMPQMRDDKHVVRSETGAQGKAQMSDTEERKWSKLLERQPITHIYKIETTWTREEKHDAKPW